MKSGERFRRFHSVLRLLLFSAKQPVVGKAITHSTVGISGAGSLDQVQLFATQWVYDYNHHRPNMALGGITPKQRLAMAA